MWKNNPLHNSYQLELSDVTSLRKKKKAFCIHIFKPHFFIFKGAECPLLTNT